MPGTKPRHIATRKGYEGYVYQPPQEPAVIITDHGFTANVIEGEHFASDAERHPVVEGFDTDRDLGDETPWGV